MINSDSKTELTLQADLSTNLALVSNRWAEIRYTLGHKTEQQWGLKELQDFTAQVINKWPDSTDALTWHGQVVVTRAEVASSMDALKFARQARDIFAKCVAMDETALNATAHISLGTLYYEMPSWPISFGSQFEARKHLQRALELFPDDIEAHFYNAGYQKKFDRNWHDLFSVA